MRATHPTISHQRRAANTSKTGKAAPSGDIAAADTLASFGRTMLAAVGVDAGTIGASITSGAVVSASLA